MNPGSVGWGFSLPVPKVGSQPVPNADFESNIVPKVLVSYFKNLLGTPLLGSGSALNRIALRLPPDVAIIVPEPGPVDGSLAYLKLSSGTREYTQP